MFLTLPSWPINRQKSAKSSLELGGIPLLPNGLGDFAAKFPEPFHLPRMWGHALDGLLVSLLLL